MSVSARDRSAGSSIKSAKNALRKSLLAARAGVPPAVLDASGLLAVPEIAAASVVAAYTPLRGEPDVLTALLGLPCQVLLPVVQDDLDLTFRLLDGPEVDIGSADVVLVPALAADRLGHRLGRGGGSYDRALVRVRADALVIAVVHGSELLASVPVEPHDVPVGAVLAGHELIRVPR